MIVIYFDFREFPTLICNIFLSMLRISRKFLSRFLPI